MVDVTPPATIMADEPAATERVGANVLLAIREMSAHVAVRGKLLLQLINEIEDGRRAPDVAIAARDARIEELCDRVSKLEAETFQMTYDAHLAVADAQRMEWLEKKGYPGQFSKVFDQRGAWFDGETPGSDYHRTLRDAIDGAMRHEEEQKAATDVPFERCTKDGAYCVQAKGHDGPCDDIPF